VLPEGYDARPLGLDDAAALAAAYTRSRAHLKRWEPVRPPEFFTAEGQQKVVRGRLDLVERGLYDCWVLWRGGDVVGAATLQNIVRGAMQGADVGYWVDVGHLRRGLATGAVRLLVERARELGLHRLGGATMVENTASQAVLRRCGFERYGVIPAFLFLDGGWRDHAVFNLVLGDGPPAG
jgi:[ribosomal protein S5]-alanine N-acetyltransferase